MGSSKADSKLHQPGVYRDEPHRDDAASTSSAVLMGDIIDTFPGDEELPAYSDSPTVPLILSHSQGQQDVSQSHPIPITTHSYLAPSLPFSMSSTFCETVWTNFPSYSTEADTLENMIKEQALYPPTYFLQINGTHTETIKRGNKEEKNRITDFFIQIDMTWLLTRTPGKQVGSESHQVLLADDQRGYRGGRLPSRTPNVSDVEEGQALRAWCDKFVSDPAGVKAFTLKREVIRHDTKQLENYIRSLIASTNYRGHVSVDFPMYRKEVVVFSPGKLNEYRTKKWLRWFFYLTFLWIFSWPVLFFLTKKYEVVKAVYPYASDPLEGERRPVVMSEMNFFQLWESSLKRGVLSRFNGVMNDEYRIATRDADARGMLADQAPPRTTGNAFADGAISILSTGLDLTLDYRSARGWGYDC